MNQQTLFEIETHTVLPHDITLSRHRGSQTSIDANPTKEAKAIKREAVYKIIAGAGANCITSKEVAAAMGEPLNCISGRISELLVLKRIYRWDEKRDKCSLLSAR